MDRLRHTLDAVQNELAAGAFHYRYSQAQEEEGCFLACTFWLVEAWAILGQQDRAEAAYAESLSGLSRGVGIYSEMIDPQWPVPGQPIAGSDAPGCASGSAGHWWLPP